MNIQTGSRFVPTRALQRLEMPRSTSSSQETFSPVDQNRESFELGCGALLTGLVCGIAIDTLGSGWGSAAGVIASGAGWSAHGFHTGKTAAQKGLKAVSGGLTGLVLGGLGAVGATIGAMSGQPIAGGLIAGSVSAIWAISMQRQES